jgi:hypothetical protein
MPAPGSPQPRPAPPPDPRRPPATCCPPLAARCALLAARCALPCTAPPAATQRCPAPRCPCPGAAPHALPMPRGAARTAPPCGDLRLELDRTSPHNRRRRAAWTATARSEPQFTTHLCVVNCGTQRTARHHTTAAGGLGGELRPETSRTSPHDGGGRAGWRTTARNGPHVTTQRHARIAWRTTAPSRPHVTARRRRAGWVVSYGLERTAGHHAWWGVLWAYVRGGVWAGIWGS